MNTGIKATLCITLTVALAAGIVTGCGKGNNRESGKSDPAKETTAASETETTILVPINYGSDTYKSVKDSNGGTLPESGEVEGCNFRITERDDTSPMGKNRGYYIDMLDQPNSPYFVIINSGERNTGGYGISVVDIGVQDGEVIITVEETMPSPNDIVTQAFTYPSCAVVFDKLPENFRVISIMGEEFKNTSGDTDSTSPDYPMDDPRLFEDDYKIPDGWIASFRNGAGEIMMETFVYAGTNGYTCINVQSTTVSWGSSQWKNRFKSEMAAADKDEVISITKGFGSDGCVIFPDDLNKACDVGEFLKRDI